MSGTVANIPQTRFLGDIPQTRFLGDIRIPWS
jgi:hypothetical protein